MLARAGWGEAVISELEGQSRTTAMSLRPVWAEWSSVRNLNKTKENGMKIRVVGHGGEYQHLRGRGQPGLDNRTLSQNQQEQKLYQNYFWNSLKVFLKIL